MLRRFEIDERVRFALNHMYSLILDRCTQLIVFFFNLAIKHVILLKLCTGGIRVSTRRGLVDTQTCKCKEGLSLMFSP